MALHIPDEKITEIRNAADIVDVISARVFLKKAGKDYAGLCPFHAEKTPSFTVSPEKQIFHCFGCGVGGNVFTFLMKYEGVSFPEAVEALARQAGINLPTAEMTDRQRQQASGDGPRQPSSLVAPPHARPHLLEGLVAGPELEAGTTR